jgi:multiple sugar transport system substrate-binding protein
MDVLGYDTGVQAWANQTMKGFNASHPGTKLQITVVPPDNLEQVLTTRVQGGDPPDISSMATAWVPSFAKADALQDVRKIMPASFLSKFNQNLLSGSNYQGQLSSLPYGSSARALFYNKDEFTKAGITSPPQTWAELAQDAAKIKSTHAAKYAFALQGTGAEVFSAWFPYFYWSYGGSFGTGSSLQVQNGACVTGLTQLNNLVNVAKVTEPNPTSFDTTEQLGAFTSGDAAMTITGPWLVGMARDKVKFGVAGIPAGTSSATLGVTDGWAVFKGSKASSKQISQVLQYLLSPSVENPFLVGRGFLPVIQSSFSLSSFSTEDMKPFVSLLSSARFVPQNAQWSSFINEGGKALQGMYVNGTSPKSVCSTIQGLTGS